MSAQLLKIQPPTRELDRTTVGCMLTPLKRARLDIVQARLYARGNPEALTTIDSAGQALRAAIDVFEQAYLRGRL